MVEKLTEQERLGLLREHSAWTMAEDRDAIERRLVFSTFETAFAFMTKVAAAAERMDHHPEWTNIYNIVDITLITHEVNALSRRDLEMIQFIDQLFRG